MTCTGSGSDGPDAGIDAPDEPCPEDEPADDCGVCGGHNETCTCDGVDNSGNYYDQCGNCPGVDVVWEDSDEGDIDFGLVPLGSDTTPDAGVPDAPTSDGGDAGADAMPDASVDAPDGGTTPTCQLAGCDGVVGSGKQLDECGVCAGDNTTCMGCDGIPNSGVELDCYGICGGGGTCGPPQPKKEYVMAIYYVPADGAVAGNSLLGNLAYTTPKTLAAALALATAAGAALEKAGAVAVPHSVGHAYIEFFIKEGDKYTSVAPATGQTGAGGIKDVVKTGAGGTILGIYAGWMNGPEAAADIRARTIAHGAAKAQLIGRSDFLLSKATWDAVQKRVALHARVTSMRYGLMLEPAIQSRQVGERGGGEGAGCTSFVAMAMFYSGAINRVIANGVWPRFVTVGEKTIEFGSYRWGSHIRNWPFAQNIRDPWRTWVFGPATGYMNFWTWILPTPDLTLKQVGIGNGREAWSAHTSITGYWYDPDKMYFWMRGVYEAVRGGGAINSLGRNWIAKKNKSADVTYPWIETDATDAKVKPLWDRSQSPYDEDWK